MYGTLDTLAVMKHFPTLSSAYVKEQWNNFKRYDTDGNGELDMAEVRLSRQCFDRVLDVQVLK